MFQNDKNLVKIVTAQPSRQECAGVWDLPWPDDMAIPKDPKFAL
jgi:hypothetical protein